MKSIFLFLFISLPVFTEVQISDYSGTWIIELAKSNFENVVPEKGAPGTMKVEQTRDSIVIIRTLAGGQLRSETYPLNGANLIIKIDSATEKTSSCKWLNNEKKLIIMSRYKVNATRVWESTRSDTLVLSDDKKSLILVRVNTFPDHTEKIKAVYNKQ